jgi:hypothetical protein
MEEVKEKWKKGDRRNNSTTFLLSPFLPFSFNKKTASRKIQEAVCYSPNH